MILECYILVVPHVYSTAIFRAPCRLMSHLRDSWHQDKPKVPSFLCNQGIKFFVVSGKKNKENWPLFNTDVIKCNKVQRESCMFTWIFLVTSLIITSHLDNGTWACKQLYFHQESLFFPAKLHCICKVLWIPARSRHLIFLSLASIVHVNGHYGYRWRLVLLESQSETCSMGDRKSHHIQPSSK